MAKAKAKASSSPRSSESLATVLANLAPAKKLPAAVAGYAFPDLQGPDGPLGPDVKSALLGALVAGALGKKAVIELTRASLTPESRDQFALALLRFWEEKEFHGRYEWVLGAVTALGGDGSIIALAGHIAVWPAQSDTGRKRAIEAIPGLLEARTDTALLALCGLRQTAVVPSVLEAIIDTLEQAVEKRGTTLSELFDVITPSLGLDARGTRSFDYGARRFSVAFDDHFVPRLRDEAGHTLEELPEPEAGDDPGRASTARALWSTLSAQLREAVKVQTFRLEQDMIGGRRWDTKSWLRHLHEHPLLVSFTRRLVWGIYDENDALVSAFRTAEDHSLVGLDDVEVKLPPKARIGVVHPQHLDEKARAAWADHFADYEIIQPFAQLGRALHAPTDAERSGTTSARFAETYFKSGVLRDVLVRKGWERDRAFLRKFYQRTFPGDRVVAIATMSPGVSAGSASYTVADQVIATIEFRKRVGRGKSSEAMPLSNVPKVAFSEVVLDLGDVLVEQDASEDRAQP